MFSTQQELVTYGFISMTVNSECDYDDEATWTEGAAGSKHDTHSLATNAPDS